MIYIILKFFKKRLPIPDLKVGGVVDAKCGLEPKFTTEALKKNNWRMMISYFQDEKEKKEGHSVYAQDYNSSDKTYNCVNSWGNFQSNPKISKDKVYGLFYVSISDCDKKMN